MIRRESLKDQKVEVRILLPSLTAHPLDGLQFPPSARRFTEFENWRGRDGNDPSVDIAKDADQRF